LSQVGSLFATDTPKGNAV